MTWDDRVMQGFGRADRQLLDAAALAGHLVNSDAGTPDAAIDQASRRAGEQASRRAYCGVGRYWKIAVAGSPWTTKADQ
jgi:hypothetical protein